MPVTLTEGKIRQLDVSLAPVYVPPVPATLWGHITDAETGLAIAGALIQVGSVASGLSGGDGRFEITDIPAGTYVLTISAEGYETLEV